MSVTKATKIKAFLHVVVLYDFKIISQELAILIVSDNWQTCNMIRVRVFVVVVVLAFSSFFFFFSCSIAESILNQSIIYNKSIVSIFIMCWIVQSHCSLKVSKLFRADRTCKIVSISEIPNKMVQKICGCFIIDNITKERDAAYDRS